MPFLDFGMDYSNLDSYASLIPNGIDVRPYVVTSMMPDQPLFECEHPHIGISEVRRDEILELLRSFSTKKQPHANVVHQPDSIMFDAQSGNWPNLGTKVLEDCIAAFWKDIAAQVPIVHQSTFSADRCEPLLLAAIIILGAAALVRSKPTGTLQDYRYLADFVAHNLRWEIFPHDDAQPPVHLWVAQALLLLELYEKMYSTRQLHERAHIHHASTLTLLRRGSPMIGRAGSESPRSRSQTRSTSPVLETIVEGQGPAHTRGWWEQWAANESMNRLVLIAFQMDTLHACM